jgi:hypothetical protein
MSRLRIAIVSVLFAALFPFAILFLGMSGPDGLQRLMWAPAESTRDALLSLCSGPQGRSFVCPYSQGQHNRVFFTSFYFVYLCVGMLIAGLVVALLAVRRRHAASHVTPNTSFERTREG